MNVRVTSSRAASFFSFFFFETWQKLTSDPFILDTMIGFRFSFISETSHDTSPHVIPINTDQTLLDQEIKELLTNNTISTIHSETIPKSHIFSAIEGFRTKSTAEFKKLASLVFFLIYI